MKRKGTGKQNLTRVCPPVSTSRGLRGAGLEMGCFVAKEQQQIRESHDLSGNSVITAYLPCFVLTLYYLLLCH